MRKIKIIGAFAAIIFMVVSAWKYAYSNDGLWFALYIASIFTGLLFALSIVNNSGNNTPDPYDQSDMD